MDSRKFFISRDIIFYEHIFPFSSKHPTVDNVLSPPSLAFSPLADNPTPQGFQAHIPDKIPSNPRPTTANPQNTRPISPTFLSIAYPELPGPLASPSRPWPPAALDFLAPSRDQTTTTGPSYLGLAASSSLPQLLLFNLLGHYPMILPIILTFLL